MAEPSRKTTGKKRLAWLTAFFLIGAAANIGVYLGRDQRDSFYPSTYKTLYVPSDISVLTGTGIVERGHVEFRIQGGDVPNQWKVTDDTGESYSSAGRYPVVKLKDYRHSYELEPLGGSARGKKTTIQFGYYPSEYYKKGGRTQPDNYWLVSASIPVGQFKRYPLSFWASSYSDIDPADRDEARRILREEIAVGDADDTVAKIEKIGCWLITKWQGCSGTPSDSIEKERSPLKILQSVLRGQGKIWCSQHALIYHFFANMAGMPTRLVSLAGRVDNVITTGHAFAETFIAEQGIWAKVDTSLNKLLILNPEGRPLNCADFYHAVLSGNVQALTARTCRDGAVVSLPYTGGMDADSYYYSYGSHLVIRPARARNQSKIAKYLFQPDFAYSLDASQLFRVYWIRRGLFLAGIIILVLWVAAIWRYFGRRR
jgi:hypothetical protein